MSEYSTKQKKFIYEILENNKNNHLTINDIEQELKKQNKEVGTATLYRTLDSLVEQGSVRKFMNPNMKPCYQMIGSECNTHFHLVCTKCGNLYHLSCDHVSELLGHIYNEHHFKVDISKIVYYGICEECSKC